jgi:dTDP-4-amino-4,6-dideoxygalactose transaminase
VTIRLVDLERQYRSIKEEIDAAILGVVESTAYVLGPEVEMFEEEFASYCESRDCVGVASGTAAIHLILQALGVGRGDEVIVPANTFISSVLPVLHLGARPVFVDCNCETATIDVEETALAISDRTKAIIAVHLYGHPADMDPLLGVSERQGVTLVEDACQAHGARYKGRRVGGLGAAAAFSFYPGKNLGAYGDGGAVTTNDDDLAQRIRLLRDLGQESKYRHVMLGWNERLDSVQAAILRVKLRHLDDWNELRRQHADSYARELADAGLKLPEAAPWAEHVWHLYVVRSVHRDELANALRNAGFEVGFHYPMPLHHQPALREWGCDSRTFAATEEWSRQVLSLPMFAELEAHEIRDVAKRAVAFAAASA